MNLTNTVIISLIAGILPALIWLIYWLQQDRKRPEPKFRIFNTFLYGMLTVPVALAFQASISYFLIDHKNIQILFSLDYKLALIVMISWVIIEEVVKFIGAYFGGISKVDNDEPIDPVIYMITAALGFSALENTLFIIEPILGGDTTTAFMTGNFRFIGATLLHVASSAIIGMFMAFSYYKNKIQKIIYVVVGFVVAIILHTAFNLFIISAEGLTLAGFASVWVAIILIIILFEQVKKIIIN